MTIQKAVNSSVAIKLETKKSQTCYFAKVKSINDDICVEYLEKCGSKYYKYESVLVRRFISAVIIGIFTGDHFYDTDWRNGNMATK